MTQKYVEYNGHPARLIGATDCDDSGRTYLIKEPEWGEISVRAREIADISRQRALEMIAAEFTNKAQAYYDIGMSKTEILRILIGVITALVFEREVKL